MVMIGLTGYVISQFFCTLALGLGVLGIISPLVAFVGFVLSRILYAGMGAAAPPAAQALIAIRTSRKDRTNALTMMASAFGLGTIVGPALAPFFTLPYIETAAAPLIFGLFGLFTIIPVLAVLTNDQPIGDDVQGASETFPSIGSEPTDASVVVAMSPPSTVKLAWRDARIFPWLMAGTIGGHAQAITGMTIGFLVLDRLTLPPAEAQQMIGLVLMVGAGASLLSQWALIPKLGMSPRSMILWGSAISAIGMIMTAYVTTLYTISIGYALACLGFGFFRPGYTAGASLAVGTAEQGDVAGKVTAVNGVGFIAGPAIGMGLYAISRPLPFELGAVAMAGVILYTLWRVRPSLP